MGSGSLRRCVEAHSSSRISPARPRAQLPAAASAAARRCRRPAHPQAPAALRLAGAMQSDVAAQQEAADLADSLFSTRKPKDVRAGLASGAKSVAKGVLAGGYGAAR